jgi:hypothetical protein
VLAVIEDKRNERYATATFAHIPYLNSSLFEETELEKCFLNISRRCGVNRCLYYLQRY